MSFRHRNVRQAVGAVAALPVVGPAAGGRRSGRRSAPRSASRTCRGCGTSPPSRRWSPAAFAGRTVMTAEESAEYEADRFKLVDHACHEGNYGMTKILSGARAQADAP